MFSPQMQRGQKPKLQLIQLPECDYIKGYDVSVSDKFLGKLKNSFRETIANSLKISTKRKKVQEKNEKRQQSETYTAVRTRIMKPFKYSFEGIQLNSKPGSIKNNEFVTFTLNEREVVCNRESISPLNPWIFKR